KTVLVSKANVHRGAATSYSVVATLKENQKVSIIDTFTHKNGDIWYRVDLGNILGWVHRSAFENHFPSTLIVATKNAVLRSGASTSYQVVEKLPANSKATAIDEFYNSSTGQRWIRIVTQKGNTGWTPEYELVENAAKIHYVYAL